MNNIEELFIANAELAAELLQHMADNEIDSDYFAVVTDIPNCGREVQSEHSVTEVALMAAGIIEQLIAQLEAAQKERDGLREKVNQSDTEWQKMADRILAVGKRAETAEAALSAANEKLSKPVVLPRMHVGFDGVSTNAGDSVRNKAISDCAEAIRTAGFTADEGKDLWLM